MWWVVVVILVRVVVADVEVELEVQNVSRVNASLLEQLANASSISQSDASVVDVVPLPGLAIELDVQGVLSVGGLGLANANVVSEEPYVNISMVRGSPEVVVELEVDGAIEVNASRLAEAAGGAVEQRQDVSLNATWEGVTVELLVDGVSWLNVSLVRFGEVSEREDVDVSVRAAQCASGEYLDSVDGVCLGCDVCLPGQVELRSCDNNLNRICRGAVQVELAVDGAAWVNASQTHLEALGALLTRYLYWNFTGFDASAITQRENVTLGVRPYPCGAGRYLSLPEWACGTCAACGPSQYSDPACLGSTAGVCRNCTVCRPLEVAWPACSPDADAVCHGVMEVELSVLGASGFDSAYLEHVFAVQAVQAAEDDSVETRAIQCAVEQFWDGAACANCSQCGPGEYQTTPCGPYWDSVCQPCSVCRQTQYVYRACWAGRDTLCFGQVTRDLSLGVSWVSQYDVADLSGYVGLFVAALGSVSGGVARVDTVTTVFQPVANVSLDPVTGIGSVPGVPFRFIGLGGANASEDGVFVYNISVNVTTAAVGLASVPDPLGLIQAALLAADQAFQPYLGVPGRRLLQAGSATCAEGFYSHDFPSLGLQCVPCLFDPLDSANASDPQGLWWTLAVQPCPSNQARVCYGSGFPPVCVPRSGVASLLGVTQDTVGPLACPQQQTLTDGVCVGVACGPGAYGQPGYCQACAAGTYQTGYGSVECVPCVPGSYSTLVGATSAGACLACQPNSWTTGQVAGDPGACICSAGFEGNQSAGCSPCVVGRYQAGNSQCQACSPGGYTTQTGAAHCLPCSPGSFQSASGASSCLECRLGEYQAARGASVCTLCATGEYQGVEGSSGCSSCGAGSFQSTAGASSCPGCPPGEYQTTIGASVCLACQPGTFASGAGQTACTECPGNGTYASGSGLSECSACGNGSYTDLPATTACLVCPAGEGVQEGACGPCGPGTEASGSECQPCQAGSASTATGGTCVPCLPGSFSPTPGGSACSACSPGSAGEQCASCVRGSYSTGYGQVSCTTCTNGKYSGVTGATSGSSCVNCEPGTYSLLPGFCAPCPRGTTSPPAGEALVECMAQPGFYALPGRPGTPCPANSYCLAGTMRPTPCPPGTTSPAGSSVCVIPSNAGFPWDWVAGPIWLLAVVLGVACLVNGRRLCRPVSKRVPPRIQIRIAR